MRIASAFLALLLTLPLTGWLILPAVDALGSQMAGPLADACAIACSMHGMHGMAEGMACPMAQNERDRACSCQISGVPHHLALSPVPTVAPEPGGERFSFSLYPVHRRFVAAPLPVAGFPRAIDHPPSPVDLHFGSRLVFTA